MAEKISIRKSTVQTCVHCHGSFIQRLGEKEFCGNCWELWQGETVWYDESGDRMFRLVSDVREKKDGP